MRPKRSSIDQIEAEDRRGETRRRVLKHARVVFNGRVSTIDVTVRDISMGGCRIRLHHALRLPSTFMVVFPSGGVERPAILMWQNGREAGVKFADDDPPEAFSRMLPG